MVMSFNGEIKYLLKHWLVEQHIYIYPILDIFAVVFSHTQLEIYCNISQLLSNTVLIVHSIHQV